MKLTMTIITNVSHGGTAFDGLPFDAMKIVIDSDLISRIQAISQEVQRIGVYKIVEFDYRPVPMKVDYSDEDEPLIEAEDVRTECDCMNVTKEDVFWSGYVKHSDERWETQSIPIRMLEAGVTLDLRDR